ncbi:hypothetical protein Aperf_G00000086725 [Anoplocephala perfoliata]
MYKTKVLLPPNFSRSKEMIQYIGEVCNVQVKPSEDSKPLIEIIANDQSSLQFSQNLALNFVGPDCETLLRLPVTDLSAFKIVEIQRYLARRHRLIVIAKDNKSLYLGGLSLRVEAISEVLSDVENAPPSPHASVDPNEWSQLCLAYEISSTKVTKKAGVEVINFLYHFLPMLESKMDSLNSKPSPDQDFLDAYRKPKDVPAQQVSVISNIGDRRRRFIVIDGANIAHGEATTRKYNLLNIRIAFDYFMKRGFTDLKIVLPGSPRECLQYFSDEEITKHFIFTPIRRLIAGAPPQRADDDSIIIQMAMGLDGVVVSNDRYRDFLARNPDSKEFLVNQVIPYNLAEGIFAISDYPLGANHKSLDELLTFPP